MKNIIDNSNNVLLPIEEKILLLTPEEIEGKAEIKFKTLQCYQKNIEQQIHLCYSDALKTTLKKRSDLSIIYML